MVDVTERQRVDVMSDGVCGLTDIVEQNTSSSEEPGMASFLNSLEAGHIEAAGSASRCEKNRHIGTREIERREIRKGRMKYVHADGRGYR